MTATIKSWRKSMLCVLHKALRLVRLHVESSVKLSKEDAEVLIARLKRTGTAKDLPQIRDGEEKKIGNFKNRCAARKTLKDLPMLMAAPQDHWFENDVNSFKDGLAVPAPRVKKHSASYVRLQAYVSTLAPEQQAEAAVASGIGIDRF